MDGLFLYVLEKLMSEGKMNVCLVLAICVGHICCKWLEVAMVIIIKTISANTITGLRSYQTLRASVSSSVKWATSQGKAFNLNEESLLLLP